MDLTSRLAGSTLAMCLLVAGWHGVAHAQQQSDVIVDTETVDRDEIQEARVLNGVDASEYVLDQARAGRSVDVASVNTAEVAGLTLVWEAGSPPEHVAVSRAVAAADPADGAEGVEIVNSDSAAADAAAPFVTGLGLRVSSVSGARWVAGGCTRATGQRGVFEYCRNKYVITAESSSTYDLFFYDRFATANGNTSIIGSSSRGLPTQIDLRSRPKSSGSNVSALVDYTPRAPLNTCGQVGSLGAGVAGFSVSIPFSECGDTTPFPNSSTKTMRVYYDQGAVFSGHNHGTEFGVVFRTPQGKTANVAHYNYVKFCSVSYLTCSTITRTQNGW